MVFHLLRQADAEGVAHPPSSGDTSRILPSSDTHVTISKADFDGLAIARQRIADEADRRTGFLDLSQLGLTELPAEMFELRHLRRLHLGFRLVEASNEVASSLGRLSEFPNLEALSIAGLDCDSLTFAEPLRSMRWFDCRSTQVSDLSPLAALG